MIRIYKDNDVKVVTKGVYNSLYKPLGYKPIIEEKKPKVVIQQPKDETVTKPDENKESSRTRRTRGE